jgi:hypothetical protein
MIIPAPACWDGVNLDSSDHRSHLVNMYDPHTDGLTYCPITHPYIIPGYKILANFTVDQDLYADTNSDGTWAGTYNGWHLSSDVTNHIEPGRTVHADWYGAWDENAMRAWEDNCIDKHLNCSAGNLGNGTMLKRAANWSWSANPRLVDPPAVTVNTASILKLDLILNFDKSSPVLVQKGMCN